VPPPLYTPGVQGPTGVLPPVNARAPLANKRGKEGRREKEEETRIFSLSSTRLFRPALGMTKAPKTTLYRYAEKEGFFFSFLPRGAFSVFSRDGRDALRGGHRAKKRKMPQNARFFF